MTSNSRLPLHLNPWSELPAFLEDAHLRRFPIHLATIDSWAVRIYLKALTLLELSILIEHLGFRPHTRREIQQCTRLSESKK